MEHLVNSASAVLLQLEEEFDTLLATIESKLQ